MLVGDFETRHHINLTLQVTMIRYPCINSSRIHHLVIFYAL